MQETIIYKNTKYNLNDLSKYLGCSISQIINRIDMGLGIDLMLSMPKDEFRFVCDKNTNYDKFIDIDAVAKHYKTSINRILTRATQLGIIKV